MDIVITLLVMDVHKWAWIHTEVCESIYMWMNRFIEYKWICMNGLIAYVDVSLSGCIQM